MIYMISDIRSSDIVIHMISCILTNDIMVTYP